MARGKEVDINLEWENGDSFRMRCRERKPNTEWGSWYTIFKADEDTILVHNWPHVTAICMNCLERHLDGAKADLSLP